MIVLVAAILTSFVMAFFAVQNTESVTIRMADYVFPGVPLYIVALTALLIGVGIAWIINIIDSISSSFILGERDKLLRETKKALTETTKRAHQLEVENEQMRKKISPANDKDELSL